MTRLPATVRDDGRDMETQTYAPPTPAKPTAVMGRRIGAWLIDWIPMWLIGVAVYAPATTRFPTGSDSAAGNWCDRINDSSSNELCIAVNDEVWVTDGSDLVLALLAMLAYSFIFLALLPGVSGWTLGKLATGIRVVRQQDFELAGIGPNIVRWLLWGVDAVPYCAPLVGLITGLSTDGNRRVGDMAASTYVVHKNDVGRLPAAVAAYPAAPGVAPPPTAPIPWPSEPPTVPPPAAAEPPSFPPPDPSEEPADLPSPDPVRPADGGFVVPGADPTATMPTIGDHEPTAAMPVVGEEPAPAPAPAPEPEPAEPRPGVDAPTWDNDRNTYIQWDPELEQWMEWDEANGRWIPIST